MKREYHPAQADALEMLFNHSDLKSVEVVYSNKFSVKATRRYKPFKLRGIEHHHEDIVVNAGRPGYRTIQFLEKTTLSFPITRTKDFKKGSKWNSK